MAVEITDPEDAKLVTLARSARARTRARGGCLRPGHSTAGPTPGPASTCRRCGSARSRWRSRWRSSSGATGLEAAAVVARPREAGEEDLAVVRDLGGPGVTVLVAGRATARSSRRADAARSTALARMPGRPGPSAMAHTSALRRANASHGCPRLGHPRLDTGAGEGQGGTRLGCARGCRAPSYLAIPPGAPVRLAKPTTNLFRARARPVRPGLDVSGLARGDRGRPVRRAPRTCRACAPTRTSSTPPCPTASSRSWSRSCARSPSAARSAAWASSRPRSATACPTSRSSRWTCSPGRAAWSSCKPGDALFDAFPNSYGSLGYATRLKIELERVPPYVALRHVRFDDLERWRTPSRSIAPSATCDGRQRGRPRRGDVQPRTSPTSPWRRWTDDPGATSDYTGSEIYYRSVQAPETDRLTIHDYLWRWDTDWFWCSGAFGLHNPRVRRLWPRRWRRSDVYQRLVALDHRFGLVRRARDRRGLRPRERVIQDIEVPVERIARVRATGSTPRSGMRPMWLCPLRLRTAGTAAWPSYPLRPGTTYVNAGFWGTVRLRPGQVEGDVNRAVEAKVTELGGHKSLYSDAYYDRETFASLYGRRTWSGQARRRPRRPADRALREGGETAMSLTTRTGR